MKIWLVFYCVFVCDILTLVCFRMAFLKSVGECIMQMCVCTLQVCLWLIGNCETPVSRFHLHDNLVWNPFQTSPSSSSSMLPKLYSFQKQLTNIHTLSFSSSVCLSFVFCGFRWNDSGVFQFCLLTHCYFMLVCTCCHVITHKKLTWQWIPSFLSIITDLCYLHFLAVKCSFFARLSKLGEVKWRQPLCPSSYSWCDPFKFKVITETLGFCWLLLKR